MAAENKNNNTGLIIGLALLTVVILAFVFRPKDDTKKDDTKKDDTKKDDTKKDDTPPIPPSVKKCWKRHTADQSQFTLPSQNLLDTIVTDLRGFYNDDFISHAAAFCKGMDIEFSVAVVKAYRTEIKEFLAKPPKKIKRDNDFRTEVQNQVFNPGDLECQVTTFSQHYLSR